MPQFMPTFTGPGDWTNGLQSLAQALFRGPELAAQAGYYGAQTRNAQIQGWRQLDQSNAQHALLGLTPGSGVPYSPPRFENTPIAGLQIMAPPGNLPMTGNLGGTVTGQPPAAPTPSPPGQTPQTALSATVAPGVSGAGTVPPAGQPGQPGQGAPPPMPTVSPGGLATLMTADKGAFSSGRLPVSSPPAPGAPPAPNTTGSDGSVPADNP